jgi:hypothetical protein
MHQGRTKEVLEKLLLTLLKTSKQKMILLLGVLLFLSGCAGYPLNMTEQEWKALAPGQKKETRESQDKIERHDADDVRCRKEAQRKILISFPAGGTPVVARGEMEISLGSDGEFYRRCMEKAGWEIPQIIDRTRTGDVKK